MTTEVEPGRRALAVAGTVSHSGEQALELEAEAGRHPDCGRAAPGCGDGLAAGRRAGAGHRRASGAGRGGRRGGTVRSGAAGRGCFDLGRDEAAHAELAALRSAPPCSPGPCEVAAELFEERGDLAAAGEWYDAAAAVLTDDELAALGGEFGWASYPANVLLGRARVRQLLGVPPDGLDDAVRRARERSASVRFRRPTIFWRVTVECRSVPARCEPCSGNARSFTPAANAGRPVRRQRHGPGCLSPRPGRPAPPAVRARGRPGHARPQHRRGT